MKVIEESPSRLIVRNWHGLIDRLILTLPILFISLCVNPFTTTAGREILRLDIIIPSIIFIIFATLELSTCTFDKDQNTLIIDKYWVLLKKRYIYDLDKITSISIIEKEQIYSLDYHAKENTGNFFYDYNKLHNIKLGVTDGREILICQNFVKNNKVRVQETAKAIKKFLSSSKINEINFEKIDLLKFNMLKLMSYDPLVFFITLIGIVFMSWIAFNLLSIILTK